MLRHRTTAGVLLAQKLDALRGHGPAVIVALNRGGVPVAYPVARLLGFPLDVIVAHAIPSPADPEVVMGSVSEAGAVAIDGYVRDRFDVDGTILDRELSGLQNGVSMEADRLRRGRVPITLDGCVAVLVDDGLANWGTDQLAAMRALRKRGAHSVVLATPVAPQRALERLGKELDGIVALEMPDEVTDPGDAFENHDPVPLEEAAALLEHARWPVWAETPLA
ncbi:MAG TPA: phosphoribosyltransferase family protein [bacterium]|nr:phosphoribosyltransferase family protein [bacterium]